MIQGDAPIAGFYKSRQVRNGPFVPVRIWFGPSRDPITGELLDRSPCWHAEQRGVEIELARVWPWCARNPIDEREYNYMIGVTAWADEHAPDAPEASPGKPLDLLNAKLPF